MTPELQTILNRYVDDLRRQLAEGWTRMHEAEEGLLAALAAGDLAALMTTTDPFLNAVSHQRDLIKHALTPLVGMMKVVDPQHFRQAVTDPRFFAMAKEVLEEMVGRATGRREPDNREKFAILSDEDMHALDQFHTTNCSVEGDCATGAEIEAEFKRRNPARQQGSGV